MQDKNNKRQSTRIIAADFIKSIYDHTAASELTLPECAIVGRSNVGKSTLVNALCSKRSLAETSKTPGRTQGINVYQIKVRQQQGDGETVDRMFHLMDLPGYGYAAAGKALRAKWGVLLGGYIQEAPRLRTIVLLCDVRREPDDLERWFLEAHPDARVLVAITKCDKLSKQELRKRGAVIAEALGIDSADLIYTSAGRQKKGIENLVDAICFSLWGEDDFEEIDES